jgi:hypothetical protein
MANFEHYNRYANRKRFINVRIPAKSEKFHALHKQGMY